MNEEIQMKPADPSTHEKPGHKFESMFTVDDRSCTVVVCSVDLATIVSEFNLHLYSKSDTLIKYSEARFSPVSSQPADHIRLATPSYYRDLEAGENSELIADDREGAYIESLNWRNRGSDTMETLKKNFTDSLPGVENILTSGKMSWQRDDFWMYCASIDPNTNYGRNKQIKHLSSIYNFMTKIEKPSKFAKQLGRDVGKQIDLDRDLKCDNYGLHILASFTRKQRDFLGESLIAVDHGPVIYLDDEKRERLLNDYSEEHSGSIIPFVKHKKYKEQQEYKFVVSVQFHSPNKDTFNLKVSDELRNLMSPL